MTEYFIEEDDFGFTVFTIGVYERSSVLAGQNRKCFVDGFEDVEAALAAYPGATVMALRYDPGNTFDHLPDDGDDGNW